MACEEAGWPSVSGPRESFPAYAVRQIGWWGTFTVGLAALNVVLFARGPLSSEALATIVALDVGYVPALFELLKFTWAQSASATRTTRKDRPSLCNRLWMARRRVLWAMVVMSLWAAGTTALATTVARISTDEAKDPGTSSAGLVIDGGSSIISPTDCRTRRQREDPVSFLSGDVTIGIDGNNPGWSFRVEDNAAPTGFDVELAEFLASEFGFNPVFRYLLPDERQTALERCEVDLVIANYSMTRERDQKIDFAGPYFLDESGLFCNEAKVSCDQAVPEEQVCVVEGTIAWEELVDAPSADSISECMQRLVDEDDGVAAFSTDRTILVAYDHYDANIDARTDTVRWQAVPGQPISAEAYGVGLPNDSPALCDEVAAALQEFVDTHWDTAFTNNLSASQAPNGHKPPSDYVRCFDP